MASVHHGNTINSRVLLSVLCVCSLLRSTHAFQLSPLSSSCHKVSPPSLNQQQNKHARRLVSCKQGLYLKSDDEEALPSSTSSLEQDIAQELFIKHSGENLSMVAVMGGGTEESHHEVQATAPAARRPVMMQNSSIGVAVLEGGDDSPFFGLEDAPPLHTDTRNREEALFDFDPTSIKIHFNDEKPSEDVDEESIKIHVAPPSEQTATVKVHDNHGTSQLDHILPSVDEKILFSESNNEDSESDEESEEDDGPLEAPSVSSIIKFAVPAVGVWLCSPLLSLIDTSAVGILSGTVQQAALNPATAVTEYAAFLIAFLYTGSTNLVAAARERDRVRIAKGSKSKAPKKTIKTLVGSVQLSWAVGAGLGTMLLLFAGRLVKLLMGQNADPAVFEVATRYVRIRALGMPAAAMIGTAQAACLGMQDVKSPLYVLLAAALVNLLGDLTLVGNSHPWVGGAAGAAWATTFSQYAAVTFFFYWFWNKPKSRVVNITDSILKLVGKAPSNPEDKIDEDEVNKDDTLSPPGPNFASRLLKKLPIHKLASRDKRRHLPSNVEAKESTPQARGFLVGHSTKRQLFTAPSKDIIKSFTPYVFPVTCTQFGRIAVFVAMSHVISSTLGVTAMAAQQVILSLYYSFAPIADSLSLTAQSFVPPLAEKRPSQERARALQSTMGNFAKVGVIFSCILSLAVATIPLLSRFSTSDPAVVALVTKVTPFVVGSVLGHSFLCAFEGILLGRKDLAFVGKMYTAWFFLAPYFVLRVKKAALEGTKSIGLTNVWTVFMSYQLFRTMTWTARTLFLQRKTNREVNM